MIISGIEPATFRFVAQHLNHWAIAVPYPTSVSLFITSVDVISVIAKMQYFLGHSRHRRHLTKATEQIKRFSFV